MNGSWGLLSEGFILWSDPLLSERDGMSTCSRLYAPSCHQPPHHARPVPSPTSRTRRPPCRTGRAHRQRRLLGGGEEVGDAVGFPFGRVVGGAHLEGLARRGLLGGGEAGHGSDQGPGGGGL